MITKVPLYILCICINCIWYLMLCTNGLLNLRPAVDQMVGKWILVTQDEETPNVSSIKEKRRLFGRTEMIEIHYISPVAKSDWLNCWSIMSNRENHKERTWTETFHNQQCVGVLSVKNHTDMFRIQIPVFFYLMGIQCRHYVTAP